MEFVDCGLWGHLDMGFKPCRITHWCQHVKKKSNSVEEKTHMCILLSVMVTSLFFLLSTTSICFSARDPFADGRNHLCIFPSQSGIAFLQCAGVRHVRRSI